MTIAPLAALRILCGVWFLPHAALKTINAERAHKSFAAVGFRPGKLFLALTVAMELAAAAGLALGWFPRIGAVLAVIVLAGAGYAVVRTNGLKWRWNMQGVEFMIFWAAACIISVA